MAHVIKVVWKVVQLQLFHLFMAVPSPFSSACTPFHLSPRLLFSHPCPTPSHSTHGMGEGGVLRSKIQCPRTLPDFRLSAGRGLDLLSVAISTLLPNEVPSTRCLRL